MADQPWIAPGEEGYATPEDAALAGWDARYAKLLGVRVEGDRANVWLLTNDRPMFEPYTVWCVHTPVGWLEEGGMGGIGNDAPPEVFNAAARLGYR